MKWSFNAFKSYIQLIANSHKYIKGDIRFTFHINSFHLKIPVEYIIHMFVLIVSNLLFNKIKAN